MSDQSDQDVDATAALRAKAERFGPGYAVMSEALGGSSLDRVVVAVKLIIAAFGIFVVLAAVSSAL